MGSPTVDRGRRGGGELGFGDGAGERGGLGESAPFVVLLVVGLGRPELFDLFDAGGDDLSRLSPALDGGDRLLFLVGVQGENHGAVLATGLGESRFVVFKEGFEQGFVARVGGAEGDENGFHVAGVLAADPLVGRVGHVSPRVANRGSRHAGFEAKNCFRTPKTPHSEQGEAMGCVWRQCH